MDICLKCLQSEIFWLAAAVIVAAVVGALTLWLMWRQTRIFNRQTDILSKQNENISAQTQIFNKQTEYFIKQTEIFEKQTEVFAHQNKLDLFDKRYQIFHQIETLIEKVDLSKGTYSITSEERALTLYCKDQAPFLFEKDVAGYIVILCSNFLEIYSINCSIEIKTIPIERLPVLIEEKRTLNNWFNKQDPEKVHNLFLPYLDFRKISG